jgi:hypothetical protein
MNANQKEDPMKKKYSKILYKYRSLEDYRIILDILLNKRLFAAEFTALGDLMEGHFYHSDEAKLNDATDIIAHHKAKYRICSLSYEKENVHMWSHYANCHTGIVFGVKVDTTSNYITKDITYTGLPDLENLLPDVDAAAIEILSHKTPEFKDEKEYRVFVPSNSNDNSVYVDVLLKEIIIGQKISDYDLCILKRLIKKTNPSLIIQEAKYL